jgi:hypothetical protein
MDIIQTDRQNHEQLVATIFRNAGFGVTIKTAGVFVWLKTRFVSSLEVRTLLIQEGLDELCTATYDNSCKGTIVTIN